MQGTQAVMDARSLAPAMAAAYSSMGSDASRAGKQGLRHLLQRRKARTALSFELLTAAASRRTAWVMEVSADRHGRAPSSAARGPRRRPPSREDVARCASLAQSVGSSVREGVVRLLCDWPRKICFFSDLRTKWF